MAKPPILPHIPTADEIGAYVIEKVGQDGTCVIYNNDTGQRTTCRLAVLLVSGQYTIVAGGPGSS